MTSSNVTVLVEDFSVKMQVSDLKTRPTQTYVQC